MNSMVWLPTLSLVIAAAMIDVRRRRIPNLLVIPFLIAGLVFAAQAHGLAGLESSMAGVALAVGALGVLCWLRALGMGDLKLCAAVGAWVGFAQLGVALVITAIAGALMAILWMARAGAVKETFDGASDLLLGFRQRGFAPHATLTLDNPRAHKMPYAPAIAIGTFFSFFC